MKHIIGICLLLLGGLFILQEISYADDADVLPKGVFRVGVDTAFYVTIDERYDPDGDAEDVAVDYNKTLDSNVFPSLGLIEDFFGMPPGSANVGRSVVSFDYDFTISEFSFAYGITDKLTAGIILPYWWARNSVSSRLNTSNASVGKNPPLNTLAPFAVPGTIPLTARDVKALLSGGLDINGDGIVDIEGFRYKWFKPWKQNGFGDLELGFRYQYLKTDNWRLAFTGGVRVPTGWIDDTDNLVDYGSSCGAYALLFRLNNDYTGIKNLVLNATFRYEFVLPDKEVQRVPDNVNNPVTLNKENVDRNLGDTIELEASGNYALAKGLNFGLTYRYGFKQKDRIDGDRGFAYESLEDETDYTEHVYTVGLSYSTIPLYMEKKFPVPLMASLSYRNRFAGSNNVFKSQYIGVGLKAYF